MGYRRLRPHRALFGLVTSVVVVLVAGCGGDSEPAPTTTTITHTDVVTTTPDWLPDMDCHPIEVTALKLKWERKFGDGIPADLPPDQSRIPVDYFELWELQRAEVVLRNISPHRVYTRGVTFVVRWTDPDRHYQFSDWYPGRGIVENPVGLIPGEKFGTDDRDAEYVEPGDSIGFHRDYTNVLGDGVSARTMRGQPEAAWVQSTDWWFGEQEVRNRCHQQTDVPVETTTGRAPAMTPSATSSVPTSTSTPTR